MGDVHRISRRLLGGSRPDLLVYGATGFTGRLVVRALLARGLRPVLAGRDEHKLVPLAAELGLPLRVARVEETERLCAAFTSCAVVLNTAGPFSATAGPVAGACLRAGAHYLDVAGEVRSIETVAALGGAARERGLMLMAGVGFDVVPSDCLALHVARRLPGARRLWMGIAGLEWLSRGSARTFAEHAGQPIHVRRAGQIVAVPPGDLRRDFDFGAGRRECLAVSWGDVVTAHYSTGISDIEVHFEATAAIRSALFASRTFGLALRSPMAQLWLRAAADLLPEGPRPAERREAVATIVAEVEDGAGRRVAARLRTPEVYEFTAISAAAVCARACAGDIEPGFQTPARVYGPDLVLSLPGVVREDLS